MITFDKIVHKLWKQMWKIFSIEDIWDIFDPDYSIWNKKHKTEIYKIIYRLKSSNVIFPLKNWLYYINNGLDVREIDIIDNNYWQIVQKIIKDESEWNYFIWWNKSLELHLKDYSIQNKLIVYTKDIQKTVQINSNYLIMFKTFKPWVSSKKFSFNYLKQYLSKIQINNINFLVAWEELALLDSLLLADNKLWIDNYLILKYLKKFEKYLSREKLWEIVRIKYISAINRLRIITQNNKLDNLYKICLDIIKNEWANCFLSLK